MSELIPLEQVRAAVLAAIEPLPPVETSREDAHGLVLAGEITATEPVPPFANTAMDGYAVRAADTDDASADAPVRLHVVDELPAGRAPRTPVGAGQAIRIMTGAPIPEGADAIVMVENTAPDGADGVLVRRAAAEGDHIRQAGGDLTAGQAVFSPGVVLTAAHLGVLASLDIQKLRAHPRARVGVLSTGDELVAAGPLTPGKIRDSNRPMLLALVQEAGADAIDLGIAVDDEDLITRTIEHALSTCDVVLTSGGVSVGDYDYVKAALDRLGHLEWRQVAIKPAKPLAFGIIRGTPMFGLPGNPVSSLVSFELFARPAILLRMGHRARFRREVHAVAAHDFRRRRDGKLHLDRVVVEWRDGQFVATSTGAQESNVLSATAAANALALIPDGDGVTAGDQITVMLLDGPADH